MLKDSNGKESGIRRKKYPKKPKVTRKYEEGGKTEKPKAEKPKAEKPAPKVDPPPKADKPTANKKSDDKPTQKKEKRIPISERTQHNTEIKTAEDPGRSESYFHEDDEGNKNYQRTTNQRERQRAEDKRKVKDDKRDYVSSSGEVDIHNIPDFGDKYEADERSYKDQREEKRRERDADYAYESHSKRTNLTTKDDDGRNQYEKRLDREVLGDEGTRSAYVGEGLGEDGTKYAPVAHRKEYDQNIGQRKNIKTKRKTKGTYKIQDADASGDNTHSEYGDTVQIKEGLGKTNKFKVKKKGKKRGHIEGIKYKTRKTRRNEQQYLGKDDDGNWIKNPKYNKRKKVTKKGLFGLKREKTWVDDDEFVKPDGNVVASNKGSVVRKYMGGGHTMKKGGAAKKRGKKKGMAVIIAIGKPKVNKKSKKGHACG